MSNNITWSFQLSTNDGQLDAFKTLVDEIIGAVKTSEPDTLTYEWFISDDGKSCHVNERFTDSPAALSHLGNFGANFAERLLALAQPTLMIVYGAPDDETRGVLDGFGAQYMGSYGGYNR